MNALKTTPTTMRDLILECELIIEPAGSIHVFFLSSSFFSFPWGKMADHPSRYRITFPTTFHPFLPGMAFLSSATLRSTNFLHSFSRPDFGTISPASPTHGGGFSRFFMLHPLHSNTYGLQSRKLGFLLEISSCTLNANKNLLPP